MALSVHMAILVFILVTSVVFDCVVALENWRSSRRPAHRGQIQVIDTRVVEDYQDLQIGLCLFVLGAGLLATDTVSSVLAIISNFAIIFFVVVFPGSLSSPDAPAAKPEGRAHRCQ